MSQATPVSSSETLVYLEAALLSLAREERLGRPKQKRLLDPEFATWKRFQGRLGLADFVELLLQDASVARPYLYSPDQITGLNFTWAAVNAEQMDSLLRRVAAQGMAMNIPTADEERLAESVDYIQGQARRLGVPSKMARSELPRSIKPQHRVLELPGTGGQLAHYLARVLPEVNLREVFSVAVANWQEWTLGGVVAVEAGVLDEAPLHLAPSLDRWRGSSFDFVVGLHPDRGGTFTPSSLEQSFPHAKIVLV